MAKPTNPKTRRLLTEMAYKFACDEATRWVRRHAYMTPTQLWKACPRGSWMLWLAETMCVFHKLLGLAACDVAEVALRHVPKDARLPAAALKVRRSHLHGKKSHKHVTAAMRATQIALDRLTYF